MVYRVSVEKAQGGGHTVSAVTDSLCEVPRLRPSNGEGNPEVLGNLITAIDALLLLHRHHKSIGHFRIIVSDSYLNNFTEAELSLLSRALSASKEIDKDVEDEVIRVQKGEYITGFPYQVLPLNKAEELLGKRLFYSLLIFATGAPSNDKDLADSILRKIMATYRTN